MALRLQHNKKAPTNFLTGSVDGEKDANSILIRMVFQQQIGNINGK